MSKPEEDIGWAQSPNGLFGGDTIKTTQTLGFEEGIIRLEHIVAALEQKEVPLETALGLFRDGVELVQHCNRLLDEAEKQMQVLLEGPDGDLRVESASLVLER